MFFEKDNQLIDYDRPTPYTFERYIEENGIKYKIIYTVRRGVADSRIISYEMIKTGD